MFVVVFVVGVTQQVQRVCLWLCLRSESLSRYSECVCGCVCSRSHSAGTASVFVVVFVVGVTQQVQRVCLWLCL